MLFCILASWQLRYYLAILSHWSTHSITAACIIHVCAIKLTNITVNVFRAHLQEVAAALLMVTGMTP